MIPVDSCHLLGGGRRRIFGFISRGWPSVVILLLLLLDASVVIAAAGTSSGVGAPRVSKRFPWTLPTGSTSSTSTPKISSSLLSKIDDTWALTRSTSAPPKTTVNEDKVPSLPSPSISLSISYNGRLYSVPSSFSPRKIAETEVTPPKSTNKPFLTIRRRPAQKKQSEETTGTSSDDGSVVAKQISPAALAAVVKPLIPTEDWSDLSGLEFQHSAAACDGLASLGVEMAHPERSEHHVDWSPSKSTASILERGVDAVADSIRDPKEGTVLVWTGKWKSSGHGSHLPVVKTVSVLPLSPLEFSSLLMDSSRVRSYNSMSLGRKDLVVMQESIDTVAGAFGIDGEAKVVRNLTQPPLSKKKMEFLTMMHARKLRPGDVSGSGYLGGTGNDGTGYVVVSRAVNDGGSGGGEDKESFIRSEILLGINLVRPIPGYPNRSEVTAITHCNTPNVPLLIAGKIGVKGAVGFVKDVRAM